MTINSGIEQQYLKRVISEYSLQTNNTECLNGLPVIQMLMHL